jgi:hypothetical protein
VNKSTDSNQMEAIGCANPKHKDVSFMVKEIINQIEINAANHINSNSFNNYLNTNKGNTTDDKNSRTKQTSKKQRDWVSTPDGI